MSTIDQAVASAGTALPDVITGHIGGESVPVGITNEFDWLKGTEWNWNNWREVIFRKDGSFLAPAEMTFSWGTTVMTTCRVEAVTTFWPVGRAMTVISLMLVMI